MCVSTSALVNVGFIGTGIEPAIPPDPACCAVNSVEQRACISISPRFLLNVLCVCLCSVATNPSLYLFVFTCGPAAISLLPGCPELLLHQRKIVFVSL